MAFVNREEELSRLEAWWQGQGGQMGMVWGRRRVGKTSLLERFATSRRTIFHTLAGRPPVDELRLLSLRAAPVIDDPARDLRERPFRDWDEAFEVIGRAAQSAPLLLVLDEFPEALPAHPELPNIIRAAWDRLRHHSQLRLLLCGSAVRTMEQLQESRAPLYGRFDLFLLLHPFAPAEVGKLLTRLTPADRALVWGIVGGTPLYLGWWDQDRSVESNLLELACRPDGRLFIEGHHVLERETFGELGRQVLFALGDGRTKYHEIADAVGTDPSRTLERLTQLRLVERMVPVTDDPRRSRRRLYQVNDNFLDFWLSCLSRHRTDIERGLGASIVRTLVRQLNDHMGEAWEQAFRAHLQLLAGRGELGDDVVSIGRFWRDSEGDPVSGEGHRPAVEIDAVALAGRSRAPVLVGEAKWARTVDGERIRTALDSAARWIPGADRSRLRYAVCAREGVQRAAGVMAVTARDIFS
jgi:AAA+ ATPase superfamily predicted ATPase